MFGKASLENNLQTRSTTVKLLREKYGSLLDSKGNNPSHSHPWKGIVAGGAALRNLVAVDISNSNSKAHTRFDLERVLFPIKRKL